MLAFREKSIPAAPSSPITPFHKDVITIENECFFSLPARRNNRLFKRGNIKLEEVDFIKRLYISETWTLSKALSSPTV
jgi:hypothetical protein